MGAARDFQCFSTVLRNLNTEPCEKVDSFASLNMFCGMYGILCLVKVVLPCWNNAELAAWLVDGEVGVALSLETFSAVFRVNSLDIRSDFS
jgi:hypothetical protein